MNKIILLTFLTLSLTACDKDFEEINRNKLEPTQVSYGALFNSLVNSLQLGWNQQLFLHNEILYDVTELGVVTAQTFGNVDSGAEDVWNNYYSALKNARELERNLDSLSIADPEVANVAKAQLKILMAYKTFQVIDLFGDIPYTEAGRAFGEEQIIRPAYDDDKEIYLSLLDDLQAASDTLINASGSTLLGNSYLRYTIYDALLNDDLGKWTKFSNSMQLKYLVRIVDKEPDLVNSRIENMLSNGAEFLSPGEDIVMLPEDQGWSNEGVNWSFREHNKLRMGTTLWNFFTDDNNAILDSRAGIFFETNNEDEWLPFPQISDSSTPQSGGAPYQKDNRDASYSNKGEGNIYASFNFYLVRDEQNIPEMLFSAADVKFLLAEIFLRGIGTPKDPFIAGFRYQEGMLASINYWQNLVNESTIWENKPNLFNSTETFAVTENPKYKINTEGDETAALQKIYTQRWVNYFRQPWEAFVLIRQTNLIPREKTSNDFFRFKYPISEPAYNSENWNAQVAKMGGDENGVRVWWM